MKTITEVRDAFWDAHPLFQHMRKKTWRQNRYNATVRSAFVAYVDYLQRDNQISRDLAYRATL